MSIENFWNNIFKTNSCWLWRGYVDEDGYGVYAANNPYNMKAHRFSYELHKSKIPTGLVIDHLCKVRNCVNPDHLEAVTNKENVMRSDGIARKNKEKTHCINGHYLAGDNLMKRKDGRRKCRQCNIDRTRKRYAASKH